MILDILIDQFTRSLAVGSDIAHRRAIVASGHGPVSFLIRQGVRDQSGEFGLQGKPPRVITIVCFRPPVISIAWIHKLRCNSKMIGFLPNRSHQYAIHMQLTADRDD